MSRIRSKDTGPEWAVRRLVYALGFRYRLHAKNLPGKPDLVFARQRKVIFVHGCFWHAHGCRGGRSVSEMRAHFWRTKLEANVRRDRRHLRELWQAGWRVLVVWECETRDAARLRATLAAFLAPSEAPANYDLADQHALYGFAAEAPEAYGSRGRPPAAPAP